MSICSYSQSVETPHRHVRTRLYFTSESHVHTVLNAFRYGKIFEVSLNYNNYNNYNNYSKQGSSWQQLVVDFTTHV